MLNWAEVFVLHCIHRAERVLVKVEISNRRRQNGQVARCLDESWCEGGLDLWLLVAVEICHGALWWHLQNALLGALLILAKIIEVLRRSYVSSVIYIGVFGHLHFLNYLLVSGVNLRNFFLFRC